MKAHLRFLFLSILLLCLGLSALAQQPVIDSIQKLLETAPNDSVKLDYLHAIAEAYLEVSPAQAIAQAHAALLLARKLKDEDTYATLLDVIGEAHFYQDQFEQSLHYFEQSMHTYQGMKRKDKIARSYNNLGIVYSYTENYEKALEYYEKSYQMKLELGDTLSTASALNNIGVLYEKHLNNPAQAQEYYHKALQIALRKRDMQGAATYYCNLGDVYSQQTNYQQAVRAYNRSIQIADSMSLGTQKRTSYEGLYKLMKELGRFEEALLYHEELATLKDTLFKLENRALTEELNAQFQNQWLDQKVKLLEKQKEQQAWAIAIVSTAGIALLLLGLKTWHLQRQRANAYKQIVAQQKELNDSLNYAARIQQAMLQSDADTTLHAHRHFVLWKPRQVVSGDFYWRKETKQYTILAVADCTGHGIPGGFISVLGMAYLGDIIRNMPTPQPAVVLDEMRQKVKLALQQTGKHREQKDGMDMAICVIDRLKLHLHFAAAHQSIFVLRSTDTPFQCADGTPLPARWKHTHAHPYSLLHMVGDNQPIGVFAHERPFGSHSLQLLPGDTLYLFTDGLPDQLSQNTQLKYSTRRFKEFLLNHQHIPLPQQGPLLERELQQWHGTYRQVDDVLVMGVEV